MTAFINQLRFFSVFFITVVTLHISSRGYCHANQNSPGEKTVNIVSKNNTIKYIFKAITDQTGLRFSYNNSDVNQNERINAPFINMPVEKVLKYLFAGKSLSWVYIDNVVRIGKSSKDQAPSLVRAGTSAQPVMDTVPLINVTGYVLDPAGKPIAGATVSVRGQSRGQGTDNTGRFSFMNIASNGVLVISSIGHQSKQVKIAGQTELRVSLDSLIRDIQGVEVFSTGYQNVPKERATGSFTNIDNRKLNLQVSTDILSRLEAVSNSILFDRRTDKPGIIVRGLSTIQGVRDPLIVVDNFPYDGNINNINPNDVESITILKDAAATSIWGTKAGNGVIVITTKKGRLNQALTVELNSNVSIQEKPDLFYNKQISPAEFVDVEKFLFNNKYNFADTSNADRPPFSPVYEILFKLRSGKITQQDADQQMDILRNHDLRDDFNKYMYRSAVNQQYAINVRGGSNTMAWIFSGGYDRNISELDAKYNRLNLRVENTYKPHKNIQFNVGFFLTNSESKSGKPAYESLLTNNGRVPIYTQLADANGKALPVLKNYRQAYLDTAGAGKLMDWNYYLLEDYKHSQTISKIQDIVARIGFQYKIIDGLSFDALYQYEKQSSSGSTLNDADSYFARNLINQYSAINRTTGAVTYNIPKGSILDLSEGSMVSHQARGQFSYNKNWRRGALSAIAGGEIRQAELAGNNSRTYGYKEDILTFVPVNFAQTYQTFVNGFFLLVPDNKGLTSTMNKFVSAFANAAYTYDDKYILSLSARTDASNLFGVKSNEKWLPLWSAGLGWNVSNEDFYSFMAIPYLKLRATYGFSGNVDQTKSAVTTISYSGTSQFTQTPIAVVSKFNNPELRWEKVGTANFGIDFRTRGARIAGSIEYYHKKGIDLFGRTPLDYTTGIGTAGIVKNVANMTGNGVDIELNTRNVNGPFSWTTNLNFSYYKDKVTKYFITSRQGSNFIQGLQSSISGIEGKPVYSIFSYKWAGLDPLTGDPRGYFKGQASKDYNSLTGITVTIDSLNYHGPALPVVFGSFNNTFTWKGFSLTAAIMYRFGHYFRRESINYISLFGRNGHGDYTDRWQKPGDEKTTNVPSLIYPANSSRENFYSGSEVLVEKADNIRLQFVTLSHNFKIKQTTKSTIANLNVYLNVNNLGILWRKNKLGLDPDFPGIPPSKSYAIGIKAIL